MRIRDVWEKNVTWSSGEQRLYVEKKANALTMKRILATTPIQ